MNTLCFILLFAVGGTPLWYTIWTFSSFRCRVTGRCEIPQGRYCGRCGKPQSFQSDASCSIAGCRVPMPHGHTDRFNSVQDFADDAEAESKGVPLRGEAKS